MLFTTDKPLDEVLESLVDENNIFLLACNGCAETCQTGGQEALTAMQTQVEGAGKKVAGTCLVDFLCNKLLVAARISQQMEQIKQADSILALTCGIGVQAVAKIVTKPVRPAANTVSLGGLQGLWPSEERCEACGDCALDYTGGLCPITSCAKSLLNGPCGGSSDGKCEVDQEKDCGWIKIYEQLKRIGKLENLKRTRSPRDHSKMLPSADLRKTSFYDL
ncbi:MAG: methylenetetrahydrofolate reductase C-terminal domain-containing protein, partial [Planctomycetota bacterium]